jgi:hypothetical protein
MFKVAVDLKGNWQVRGESFISSDLYTPVLKVQEALVLLWKHGSWHGVIKALEWPWVNILATFNRHYLVFSRASIESGKQLEDGMCTSSFSVPLPVSLSALVDDIVIEKTNGAEGLVSCPPWIYHWLWNWLVSPTSIFELGQQVALEDRIINSVCIIDFLTSHAIHPIHSTLNLCCLHKYDNMPLSSNENTFQSEDPLVLGLLH